MDVILLEKTHRLGDLGERVSVKPGYGRNYLIPQKKAIYATKENIERFEIRRAELERAEKEAVQKAGELAEKLKTLSVTLEAQVTEEGKLYGSVGTREIADAIEAAGVVVEKSQVLLPEGPMRELGEYQVDIQLHGDAKATVTVNVTALQ